MKTLRIVILLAAAALAFGGLTSCHTSKKATHGQVVGVKGDPLLNREIGDGEAATLLREAFSWLGTPYSYGGHSKKGTDCSGFVMEVYKAACNLLLPRNSAAQGEFSKSVKRNDLRIGDLLFFSNKGKGRISHVGLYIGNGEMIHASTSRGVIVSRLDEKYYATNYNSAGRVKDLKTSKSKSKKKANAAPAADKKPAAAPKQAPAIPLDELIDSKIDSIFSSSFMD